MTETDVSRSKRYQFRLPLDLAIEVDREIELGSFEGCATPTTYFKRLVELRKMAVAEKMRLAKQVAELIKLYGISKRDLLDAGLSIDDVKPR